MATGTEAVLQHHGQALVSRKLDDIMKDYTDDSVLFTPTGTLKGLKSIRAGFTEFMKIYTPELMAKMKVIKQDIHGEYAYLLWSALPVVPFGGDTFYVRNGKIMMQSFVTQMGS
jgi:ketosteroid isomerase-like protein